MTSRETLSCSATLSKIAALQKEVIAGFPGSNNKQEDIKPGIKPAGLIFCSGPNIIALHPGNSTAVFCGTCRSQQCSDTETVVRVEHPGHDE